MQPEVLPQGEAGAATLTGPDRTGKVCALRETHEDSRSDRTRRSPSNIGGNHNGHELIVAQPKATCWNGCHINERL
jgi:hypothetical protein